MEIGDRFGKLTVISINGKKATCRCDCGKEVDYCLSELLRRKRSSCGCLAHRWKPLAPGTRFGRLTVISCEGSKVLCRCDCGNEKTFIKSHLLNGHSKSCGCLRSEPKYIIAPGTRFGKLTVISANGTDVLCRCDCGNETTITKSHLIKGHTKSCGCLLRESKYIITPGSRFGKLTVISANGNDVLCRCDCGNEKIIYKYSLIKGHSNSCGCLLTGRKPIPIASGTRFGRLTVISCEGSKALCRCDCGNEVTVQKYSLLNGNNKSCGCSPKGRKPVPIVPGTRFGKLTVISYEGQDVLCRCDCGNEKMVKKNSLTNGLVKSCGCLPRGRKPNSTKHSY